MYRGNRLTYKLSTRKAEVIDKEEGRQFRDVPDFAFGHCLLKNATPSHLCMKLNIPRKMTQYTNDHPLRV